MKTRLGGGLWSCRLAAWKMSVGGWGGAGEGTSMTSESMVSLKLLKALTKQKG